MSDPIAGMKQAIALITAGIEVGSQDDDAPIENPAHLLEGVDLRTTVTGLLSVSCMLVQVAAHVSGETPAAVLEQLGMAVALREAGGPGRLD